MKPAKTHAFTLIELLVVVAIIAILATLLVPIVGKSLRRARSSQCTSNLRQIGVAIRLYSLDHDGRYPLGYADNNAGFPANKQGDWTYWLNEYLGGRRMTNWMSQSDRDYNRSKVIMCPEQGTKTSLIKTGYSAHPHILVDPAWGNAPKFPDDGLPLQSFKRPSEVVMVLDGLLPSDGSVPNTSAEASPTFHAVCNIGVIDPWNANPSRAETPIALDFAAHNTVGLGLALAGGWPAWRHDGAVNTLRVDGHVEPLKLVGKDGQCEFKEKHVALNY